MARGYIREGKLYLIESLVLVGIVVIVFLFAYLFWDLNKFYAFIGRSFYFSITCLVSMILGPVLVLFYFDVPALFDYAVIKNNSNNSSNAKRIMLFNIIEAWESAYITVAYAYHLFNSFQAGVGRYFITVCLIIIVQIFLVFPRLHISPITVLPFLELAPGCGIIAGYWSDPWPDDPVQIHVVGHIGLLIPVYISIFAATVVTIREMIKSAKNTK